MKNRKANRTASGAMVTDVRMKRNLLDASHHDDDSVVDQRVFTVPPPWVSLVDELNEDTDTIKKKSARAKRLIHFPRVTTHLCTWSVAMQSTTCRMSPANGCSLALVETT